MAISSEIQSVRGQGRGSFTLTPSPVRLSTSGVEVVAFVRGAARVGLPGGPPELVDSVTAVWCAADSVTHWAAVGTEGVRVDWHAPSALAVAIGAVALDLPASAETQPVRLYYSKPRLFLKQRLLTELGQVPRTLSHSRGGWLAPMTLEVGASDRTRPGAGSPGRRLVSAARAHLAQTYRSSVTVPEIASDVGSSMAHLSRLFKRYTGLPLVPYRHQLRMRAALDLLDRDPANLMEMALDLGYASHSHFTGRFKRTFGLTPSHYRRLARRRRGG